MLISQAQPIDAGTYTLCAKNIAGIAYTSCEVAVQSDMTVDSEVVKPKTNNKLRTVKRIKRDSFFSRIEIIFKEKKLLLSYRKSNIFL